MAVESKVLIDQRNVWHPHEFNISSSLIISLLEPSSKIARLSVTLHIHTLPVIVFRTITLHLNSVHIHYFNRCALA